MSMSRGEAQSLRIMEALGAHIIADSYRDTVPDDDHDAAYLRKHETFWRMTARAWLCDADSEKCHAKAKHRMADSPEFKAQLEKISATLACGEPMPCCSVPNSATATHNRSNG